MARYHSPQDPPMGTAVTFVADVNYGPAHRDVVRSDVTSKSCVGLLNLHRESLFKCVLGQKYILYFLFTNMVILGQMSFLAPGRTLYQIIDCSRRYLTVRQYVSISRLGIRSK